MAGMSALTVNSRLTLPITAQNNVTGADYSPTANQSTINKTLTLGTASANGAANGSDEIYSTILTVTGGSNTTIDLTNITDLLNTAAVNLVRVKMILIRNLDSVDDPTNAPAPNASFITVGNNGANDFVSTSGSGWFNTAASVFDVAKGDFLFWGTKGTAGSVTSGSKKIIKLVNGDGTNTAKIQVTIIGGSS